MKLLAVRVGPLTLGAFVALGLLVAGSQSLAAPNPDAEKTWAQKIAPTRAPPAQSGNQRAAYVSFARLDRNGDGVISAKEWAGRDRGGAMLFALLDRNGDKTLSRAEVSAASQGRALGQFAQWDANGDGKVSAQEFPVKVQGNLLKVFDQDGDGALSLAEVRPGFKPPTQIAKLADEKPHRRTARDEKPAPYCWVPAFGKDIDGFNLQAVITTQKCRR